MESFESVCIECGEKWHGWSNKEICEKCGGKLVPVIKNEDIRG